MDSTIYVRVMCSASPVALIFLARNRIERAHRQFKMLISETNTNVGLHSPLCRVSGVVSLPSVFSVTRVLNVLGVLIV